MSFSIRRTIAARGDLEALWLAIAVDDIELADRQLDRIEDAIARLSDYPSIGSSRDDLVPGMRTILRSPYLVFYRVVEEQKRVDILRVVDGRRDLKNLEFDQ